jgi:hypothetical protein
MVFNSFLWPLLFPYERIFFKQVVRYFATCGEHDFALGDKVICLCFVESLPFTFWRERICYTLSLFGLVLDNTKHAFPVSKRDSVDFWVVWLKANVNLCDVIFYSNVRFPEATN